MQTTRDNMCWNAAVSLNTFLFGAFGIGLAALNGYPPAHLLFVASYVVVQLLEHFVWRDMERWQSRYNAVLAAAVLAVVLLQPVASALQTGPELRAPLLAAYALALAGTFAYYALCTGFFAAPFRAWRGADGHLVYSWMRRADVPWLLLAVYLAFFLGPLLLARRWWVFAGATLALAISVIGFWRNDTWASMWCWFANVAVFGMVGYILFWRPLCTPTM